LTKATITARKLAVFSAKQAVLPNVASKAPAMTGPTIRVMLKMEELSAMALPRSSRPTISIMNAWRIGTSKATQVPRMGARIMIHPTVICPVAVSTVSARDSSSMPVCSSISAFRLSTRSASTPP
jgi:hypothetical protein